MLHVAILTPLVKMTGQSLLREAMSATLVVVGTPFYANLGPPIATSILAAIATVLAVLPFVFWRYGPAIRSRSAYSQAVRFCLQALESVKLAFLLASA